MINLKICTKLLNGAETGIGGLYFRYGRRDDADIKRWLSTRVVGRRDDKMGGYIELSKTSMEKLMTRKSRSVSLTFDAWEADKVISGLEYWKTITFLVKSTSRFFLKPDIGEIIDQLCYDDYHKVKGVCLNEGHYTIPETEGEHFLMTADLLIEPKQKENV